jgi:hypothetical protein
VSAGAKDRDLVQGMSENHTFKKLSQNFGRGDGCGRYVSLVYYRKAG